MQITVVPKLVHRTKSKLIFIKKAAEERKSGKIYIHYTDLLAVQAQNSCDMHCAN